VQPALAKVRRTVAALIAFPLVLAAVVIGWVADQLWISALAVLVGGLGFGWYAWLVGRQVKSWGYAERDEDLLITHGLLFRRLVVVPYGRMQFVDVTAGPLERWAGIVTVQLHTASAASDARIPGLLPDEGARLRDQLAERGSALAAGL
jgi:membrane protein YdbS with pleckstrin-like domain